jgi:hypothetical protein
MRFLIHHSVKWWMLRIRCRFSEVKDMRILLGLALLAASLLAHPFDRGVVQAQQIVLPCVPSGNSCIPVSAANPLPTTGGSGGGSPGGSNTQVQYNNSTAFGGTSAITTDGTNATIATGTGTLTVGAGSAITSSGPGGVLGSNAFNSTAYAPLASPTFTGTATASGLLGTSSAGSAAAPSLFVGNSTTGLFSASTTGFGISINGVTKLDYGIATGGNWTIATNTDLMSSGAALLFGAGGQANVGALINSSGSYGFNVGNAPGSNNIGFYGWTNNSGSSNQILSGIGTFLTSPAPANVQFGYANVNGAPVAQTISFQGALAGSATNQASPNTTVIGALGTGTGTNGDLILQTGVKTTTGSVQATATTAMTIKGETQAVNFAGPIAATLASAAGTNAVCNTPGTSTALTVQVWATGCAASSARFKTDLADIPDAKALDIITGFRSKSYRYIATEGDGGADIHFGFTAEQVREIDPDLITFEADGVTPHAVKYNELWAFAAGAIRALKAKVDALEAR